VGGSIEVIQFTGGQFIESGAADGDRGSEWRLARTL
jgi:hypothetical protein